MKRIIVVDDDRRTRRVLQIMLERLDLESKAFENPEEALAFLSEEKVALVLTDLRMPGLDGIEFMRRLRQLDESVPVIMATAYGTIESAVEAMKLGALDYITKPFDVDHLEALIARALELARYRRQHTYLREVVDRAPAFEEIVGPSSPMQSVFDLIRKVGPTRSSVLITGETGTGKELVARAVHKQSPRRDQLFVPLNCAAIPKDLLESELFGHVRGSFTGALADREGKFQAADGGTLFLDEIGDMDIDLQAKLLRVLQEGLVQPVGTHRQVPVDVRIVSSTNCDLESAMRSGCFREDLYYRLNVFRIELPSLRDRRDDIPTLAASFLQEFGRELGKQNLHLSGDAEAALGRGTWRGNVRELRNVMERVAVIAEDGIVSGEVIRSLLPLSTAGDGDGSGAEDQACEGDSVDLASAVAETERKTILRALARSGDNKTEAAALLGIGERTLWTKLRKHEI